MKKRLLILMIVTGMIILLGGLLTYGLGIHEIIPVPRPDLIVVGTSLIGILLIASGACDLFVKKTKEMEIEENDERNISLSNAAMASGFKVMNVTISVSIFVLIFTGYMTVVPCFTMMPKIDGYTVCEMIRQESNVPIIMLTALDEEQAQIKAFELKADDYITKPFSLKLVLLRVEAVLRRIKEQEPLHLSTMITYDNASIIKLFTSAGSIYRRTGNHFER